MRGASCAAEWENGRGHETSGIGRTTRVTGSWPLTKWWWLGTLSFIAYHVCLFLLYRSRAFVLAGGAPMIRHASGAR